MIADQRRCTNSWQYCCVFDLLLCKYHCFAEDCQFARPASIRRLQTTYSYLCRGICQSPKLVMTMIFVVICAYPLLLPGCASHPCNRSASESELLPSKYLHSPWLDAQRFLGTGQLFPRWPVKLYSNQPEECWMLESCSAVNING